MAKFVLSVGNCGFDNSQLSHLVSEAAQLEMRTAHSIDEGAGAVDDDCQLVLINRVFDRTREQGLELVTRLQSERPETPTMLISNYADAQQAAVKSGALPGFGKSQLGDAALVQRLSELLSAQEPKS